MNIDREFPHELFEQLDAVAPRWQSQYKTLVHAAQALDLHEYLEDYLRTELGQRYIERMAGVIDWQAVSERNRRQREAEIRMTNSSSYRDPAHSGKDAEGWNE